jgi:cullin 3
MYRNAYKLVLKKQGETLYNKVKEFEEDWLLSGVQPQILQVVSPSLLDGHTMTTATTNANEKRIAGEKLMRGLKQAWEDHNLYMGMTSDVLMYLVYILGRRSSFSRAS